MILDVESPTCHTNFGMKLSCQHIPWSANLLQILSCSQSGIYEDNRSAIYGFKSKVEIKDHLPVPAFPPSCSISQRHPWKSGCSTHIKLCIFFLTDLGMAASLMLRGMCT